MLRLAEISLTYEPLSPLTRQALRGVSLTVDAGDRLGLCGPSGAGKSSLLLILAGLYTPSGGRVERTSNPRIGLVLQEPETALFARTVHDELAFAPRRLGLGRSEIETAVVAALAATGLPSSLLELDPFQLPTAERRLVAITAVLTGQPDLLLLDEPTAGLAGEARARLLKVIRDFPGTVVVASHDLDLLWRLCSRLAVLDRGRLFYDGGWVNLLREPEILTGIGLDLPAPLQVLSDLVERGWQIGEPGRDEAAVAEAITRGHPGN